LYSDVKIKDFLYYTPVGFISIDHTVKSSGYIFDYTYEFSPDDKIQLNYFTTELSETLNNSNKGGYIKYTGRYDSFEYFSSLIYRNGYKYLNVKVDNSFNFNLGATYNITKNSSISLKAENLFDNSTKSLHKEGLMGNDFALEDYQREVTLTMKWVF
jgi:iron complex outermembrane receptor protein